MSTIRQRWRRASRRVVVGALAAAVLVLCWLSWQLVVQDRTLERQRVDERLRSAADLIAASLQRDVAAASDVVLQLSRGAEADRPSLVRTLGPVAAAGVAAVMTPTDVWTSVPLVYYPNVPDPVDDASDRFLEGERLEFASALADARAAYHRQTRASDPMIEAGALLREARVTAKLGDTASALTLLASLEHLAPAESTGRPADLVALFERCQLLAAVGRTDELSAEAETFRSRLWTGAWKLSASQFAFYAAKANQWRGRPPDFRLETERQRESIAAGFAEAARDEAVSASTTVTAKPARFSSGPSLVVGQRSGRLTTLIFLNQDAVERTWFGDLQRIAAGQRVRASLRSSDGDVWFGQASGSAAVVRAASLESGLPWSIAVESADPIGDRALVAGRREVLIGLLVTISVVLVGAGYTLTRSVSRDLEVARLQSDFVAAVSHELRTPVASMRQLSELLDDGRVPTESRRAEYYRLLRRESERLHRLVEGLLDFGRMESSTKVYRFECVELAALVQDVTQEFQDEHADDAARLHVMFAEAGAAPIDREAMGRAVRNLIDNAIKYSPRPRPVEVTVRRAGRAAAIEVTDHGPGIPVDEREAVFEKFVRGRQAEAGAARGTGLGLAMARHIAQAHGGTLTLVTTEGQGSTFTLTIPTKEAT